MEPTGKIAPQPWMTAPETRAVMAALTADGGEARFVGGCVRDAVVKRPVDDVDVATTSPPETVMDLLDKAGIKAVPTGIKHGTVSVFIGAKRMEITTLRVDVETDGRHARVAFTDDWTADAARRDFTINTLSCTMEGDIFDPFNGLEDLAYGRVRFVGRAQDRIEEDVLRLLRFFRFFGTYGLPPIDLDALAACRALAHRLPDLSSERVRDEILKILMTSDPVGLISLMRGERILEPILPEIDNLGRLRVMTWLDSTAIKLPSVAPDALRRLAAVLETDAEGAGAVARRLRLSNNQTERLRSLAAPPSSVSPDTPANDLRHALHSLGAERVRDIALMAWAAENALTPRGPRGRNQAWVKTLTTIDSWIPVTFPLKGRDVTALGIAKGPRVGELLRSVEEWWKEDGFRADREHCLEHLASILNK